MKGNLSGRQPENRPGEIQIRDIGEGAVIVSFELPSIAASQSCADACRAEPNGEDLR
jgi:hypothetical protein